MSIWMPGGYAFEGGLQCRGREKTLQNEGIARCLRKFLQSNWCPASLICSDTMLCPTSGPREVLAVVLKFCPNSSIDSLQ